MIVGIGTDIVDNNRFRALMKRQGEKLLMRLFTENERTAAKKRADPAPFFAKRFAAKEAYAKALGTGIGAGVSFQDIEIISDKKGAPSIRLLKNNNKKQKPHLTLSDEKDFSIAFVVIEKLQ